jgi:hypothetical protein
MKNVRKSVSVKRKKDNRSRTGAIKSSYKMEPRKKFSRHEKWEFKPKLENMSTVLCHIDNSLNPDEVRQWIDRHRGEIQKLIRSNGFTEGAKRINLVRDYTLQLVEGRKPENPPWLATSEVYSVPSCLHEGLIKYIVDYLKVIESDSKPPTKPYQVLQTILNIHRIFEGLVDTKFDSVLEKSRNIDPELLVEFDYFVEGRISQAKESGKLPSFDSTSVDFMDYRLKLNKNGPNGQPKLETSHSEAIKLRQSTLWQPWSWLTKLTGQEYLVDYVDELAKQPIPITRKESTLPLEKVRLRKLKSVPDKGLKTRLVAICDFWTQATMNPIRAYIQLTTEILFNKYDFRLMQQDGVNTMIATQKSCINSESIGNLNLNSQMLKAYDISAWTDRFHRDLQKVVMKNLFSSAVSEKWAQLTVHCEWYTPELDSHIKYGQGQGMGTNGSFDIATLTDHLWIHFMYHREYQDINLEPTYGKVGDDLWILDPKDVYPEYCEKINLPINFSKSKVFCKLGSVMEFCSRSSINGDDASRISPSVVNRSSDFRNIPQLLSVLNERGVVVSPKSFPSLNRRVKGKEETYFDKLQPWLLSAVVANLFCKESSPYRFLTAEYLFENDWLKDDHLCDTFFDQECLMRLAIVQSILSILESQKVIEMKVQALCEAKSKMSYDEFKEVFDTNLFTSNSTMVEFIRERIFSDKDLIKAEDGSIPSVLLPMEIIPLKRLKSLNEALTVKLLDAHSLEGDKVDDIIEFASRLRSIATTVDFEGTTLSYDSKRAYNVNFKIVKYLERTSSPYDILVLETQQDKDLINSILSYEELPQDWVRKYLPVLVAELDSFPTVN